MDDEAFTCCSPEQILTMEDSIQMAEGVIARCPTCLKNFLAHICDFTCSADQSDFATPEIVSPDFGEGKKKTFKKIILLKRKIPTSNLFLHNVNNIRRANRITSTQKSKYTQKINKCIRKSNLSISNINGN